MMAGRSTLRTLPSTTRTCRIGWAGTCSRSLPISTWVFGSGPVPPWESTIPMADARRRTAPWYKGSKLGPKIIDFVWNQFTPVLGREKIKPEFWAYYADYDWVVFCQLFGSMIDLPQGFPMYCRDIKQKADEVEEYLQREHDANFRLRLPKQMGEHNALADAQWNRKALANLETYADDPQLFMRKYGESKVFMELEAK
jgi:hypothetical protein